jgi:hypothetical protein
MTNIEPYPIRIRGHLDPTTSRWLWLVKWLLLLPQAITLVGLWIAGIVLTVVAGVAILITGRYPRRIFDFNVGVLRWSWRVGFYGVNGLATDRYPPWTLAPDPSYPADLEVDYPEHLSRGLVLVKWWLLAIPQYLIVGILAGGSWHVGLIGLLALVAAVALLFTGRYPQPLFDLVMGLDRWCLRVAAYVLLMTDRYPPFRLDMGGADPGDAAPVRPAPTQPVSV